MNKIVNFIKCHKLASIAIICVLAAIVVLCILLNQNKKTNTPTQNRTSFSKGKRDFSCETGYHFEFRCKRIRSWNKICNI